MKLWIKYLLGAIIGVFAALVLPPALIDTLAELAVRIGRYTLLPLLFFSASAAFFRVHAEKKLLPLALWLAGAMVIFSLGITIVGVVTAVIFPLPPIPISSAVADSLPAVDIQGLLRALFPSDGFSSLLDGAFLLPAFVFAGFAGIGCAADVSASRPLAGLLDSASKVCYIVMSFFVEILSVGMIAFAARWTLQCAQAAAVPVLAPLLWILILNFVLVVLVGIPLVLRFFCHELHPFKVVYASVCPMLLAFASGDTNLALLAHIRHGKESLGIRRRTNAITLPVLSAFARGGASAVSVIGLLAILRSYSSLGVSFADIVRISATAFALSFALGNFPSRGPFIVIGMMCAFMGRVADGYQLLTPVAPLLCAFAAAIDAAEVMAINYIVAVKTRTMEHVEIKKFI